MINLICLNKDNIAILSDGRIHFSKIESDLIEKIFPLKDTDDQILYTCLTDNFIIYSDSNNKVKIYNIIDNCANIGEFRFDNPIKKIFPNPNGTKYLCIDNLGKAFLYNPITETVIKINNEFEYLNIIWDSSDVNTFAAYTRTSHIYTYHIIESSLEGPKVEIIKDFAYIEEIKNPKIQPYSMKLDSGCYPFYLNNGYLSYYSKNTKEIKGNYLLSHYWIFNWRDSNDTDDGHKKYFMQNFQLGRYWNCMKAISHIKTRPEDYYDCLGKESLKKLEINVAEEAFRKAKNTSLVLTVENLREVHEKKLLLGLIAQILGEEEIAQDLFTNSSKPEYALDLRIDLQDWNIALKLAKDFKPHKQQFISRKIGYEKETQEQYAEALKLYEKSLIVDISKFLEESEGDYDKDGKLKKY
jgi:WD repeat-containing protein 19